MGEERGGRACQGHGAGGQGTAALGAAARQELLFVTGARHRLPACSLRYLGTRQRLWLFRLEFRYGCFSAPNVGIAQTTKPGWFAVVKNKEVLVLQVPYEGLVKNTGNRSCERGNGQTHTVFTI